MKNSIKYILSGIFLLFFILLAVFAPKILDEKTELKNKIVCENAQIFTKKALDNFNSNKNEKASTVAKNVMEQLNEVAKNPYNKKLSAFTNEKAQKGQIEISTDDTTQTITLTALDVQGKILIRTLIKPPSFVTYTKSEEENGK